MAQSGVQQEILELRTRLNRANRAYHVDAAPTMSDREYDEQLARLATLETEHPEFDDPDSQAEVDQALAADAVVGLIVNDVKRLPPDVRTGLASACSVAITIDSASTSK